MVSLVLLSHSPGIVSGVKDLALEMASDINIYVAGGNGSGGLGSDYELIKETIEKAYTNDGIIILYDLGSSAMTASLVLDELEETKVNNIKMMNAPLVEGAIVAAVEIASGATLLEVEDTLKEIEMIK
jgi:dihydroxyacetone kinase phosphotransfer subunit